MNFAGLQDRVFKCIGLPDTTADRTDAIVMSVQDAINETMEEIAATCHPSLNNLTRVGTLTVVSGTGDYLLNDWAQRLLSIYTEGPYAHQINVRRPAAVDRDGSRGTYYVVGQLGPYQLVQLPRTLKADGVYGAAGSSTGASVAEDGTAVTFGSGGTVLTSDLVGKMICFNGESADYQITAVGGSHACTVDRPVKARFSGLGTARGVGYTNKSWQISPQGRYKLRFLPLPTNASTVYYRYMAYPRRLLQDDDQPELQTELHHLLWKGAMRSMTLTKQNADAWQMYTKEFNDAIEMLRKSDDDDYAANEVPQVESLYDNQMTPRQPGEYRRGRYQRAW